MNTRILAAGLLIALLPVSAPAAPAKAKTAPKAAKIAALYECRTCHMKVSAAVAKKDGYKDPMDGGKLVPVKATK